MYSLKTSSDMYSSNNILTGLKTIPLMISREDVVPWMELCMVNQSKKPDQELSISRPGKDIKSVRIKATSLENTGKGEEYAENLFLKKENVQS
jgi:hypothetical protein